jgi:hypothetical protein
MSLEKERTYKLLWLTTKVCLHCQNYKTDQCPYAPSMEDSNYWSSLSACDNWTPNAHTDQALQILTMRKLAGEDIEWAPPEDRK